MEDPTLLKATLKFNVTLDCECVDHKLILGYELFELWFCAPAGLSVAFKAFLACH